MVRIMDYCKHKMDGFLWAAKFEKSVIVQCGDSVKGLSEIDKGYLFNIAALLFISVVGRHFYLVES